MQEDGWRHFLELCLSVDNPDQLSELFGCFLTAEERESIATRYLIVKSLLAQEKPQRQMSEELQVSISKITRGSNELKRISPQLKQYLIEKLKQK